MSTITLYGKPGCHLCEEAREQLEAVRADVPFALEEVDVSIDPVLHRSHGARIPVVELEGEELFEYHVDPRVLREALGRVARS